MLTVFLLNAFTGTAQFKTQQFVDNIPSLPGEGCKTTDDDRSNFIIKVKDLQKEIDDQIKKAKRETKVDENQVRNAAINQMAAQYGLSEDQVNKMKNKKKMSAEEKTALADSMMQMQTNISIAEINNMKKMTPQGKKEWAKAYGAEAYAMGQANQGSNTQQKIAGSQTELALQLQNLNAAVQQRALDIQMQYNLIENDPERIISLGKIQYWDSLRVSMTGQDNGQGEKMDSLSVLIKKEKDNYCEKYTPQYWKVLNTQYANLKASYADYIRIADLNRAVANMQPVKLNLPVGPEINYMEYIRDYLDHLSAAFIYKLN